MSSTAAEIAMLDAIDQAALVRDGEVAAAELVEGAIERIDRLNPSLGAVVTTLYDQARATVAACPPSGPFGGVPYLLKDLVVEIEGTPPTCEPRLHGPTRNPWDPRRDTVWFSGRPWRPGLVIGHHDAAPYNVVWRGSSLWVRASPGRATPSTPRWSLRSPI